MRSDRWTMTGPERKLPHDISPGPMQRTDCVVISSCIANRSPMSCHIDRSIIARRSPERSVRRSRESWFRHAVPNPGSDMSRQSPARSAARSALALERERRISAQDPVKRLQRQRVDQVLGESVGKIFVGTVTEIGEGKHPTIAVRYWAGRFDGFRDLPSAPPGSQVQTCTGSAMFLKR